ncbi:MAG: phage tail assembly protein [Alphaproteobacteria bacterium]|nr:phage tail assembly protein [Alphaproteobacteria bacterium]
MPQLMKTIVLEEPLEWNGQTYTELTLKELTAGQLQEALNGETKNRVEQTMKFISLSTGLPAVALKGLLARDYSRAQDFILDFLSAPLDGGASSPA